MNTMGKLWSRVSGSGRRYLVIPEIIGILFISVVCGAAVALAEQGPGDDITKELNLSLSPDPAALLANTTQGILWERSLGGSGNDSPNIILPVKPSGYLVAGGSESGDGDRTKFLGEEDFWVVNLSGDGKIVWEKSYGGSGTDVPYSIQQTDDGGYILVGRTNSSDSDITANHGDYDLWVVRISPDGRLLWQRALGGSEYEHALSIENTADKGYIVAGCSRSSDGDLSGNHGEYDAWVVKLSAEGAVIWQKNYGGSGTDIANNVKQTRDGGYIVVGDSASSDGDLTANHGGRDYWALKLDTDGRIEWQKTFGGSGDENAYYVQETGDGYIIVGRSRSADGDVTGNHGGYDFWVVKLTAGGEIEWERTAGGTLDDEANSVLLEEDGSSLVSGGSASSDGDVTANQGDSDFWAVRFSPDGNMSWQRTFGGSGYDYGQSIAKSADRGYVLAGESGSSDRDVTGNHGAIDYWIVRFA